MKKLLLVLSLLLLTSVRMDAKSVVFTLTDGTLVYYLLGGDTDPMLRFSDGIVTVEADSYALSNIKNFYISETDDPNAIERVLDSRNMSYSGGTLVFRAATQQAVKVYAADGREVEALVSRSGDLTTVCLSALPAGTYIVRAGQSSVKVLKK